MPLHSRARTTRLLDTGGRRTDTIPILGGLIPFSSSHGRRRRHLLLDIVSRRDLGKADDLGRCDGRLRFLIQPQPRVNSAQRPSLEED